MISVFFYAKLFITSFCNKIEKYFKVLSFYLFTYNTIIYIFFTKNKSGIKLSAFQLVFEAIHKLQLLL